MGWQPNNHLSCREYMEDAPAAERGFQRVMTMERDGADGGGFTRITIQTLPSSDLLQSRRTKGGHPQAADLPSSKGGCLYHSRKGVLNPCTYGLPDIVRE